MDPNTENTTLSKMNKGSIKRKKKESKEEIEKEDDDSQKAKRRAQIAKAARKHRQRQKDELEYLRSKVNTLEDQIGTMQSSQPLEQPNENGWKHEAKQQAEIRSRVDRENEFLRTTLAEQLSFTQKLQLLLTNQPVLGPSNDTKPGICIPPIPSLPENIHSIIQNISSIPVQIPPIHQTIVSARQPIPSLPKPFEILLPSKMHQTKIKREEMLKRTGDEAMARMKNLISRCDDVFLNLGTIRDGIEVHFSLDSSVLNVFLRKQNILASPSQIAQTFWDATADINFNQSFPFVDFYELIQEIDVNTRYGRTIGSFMESIDIKAETLGVFKRGFIDSNPVFAFKSVSNDDKYPQIPGTVQQIITKGFVIRSWDDGLTCEISGCVSSEVPQDLGLPIQQVSNIFVRNIFQSLPKWLNSIVQKSLLG